MEHISRARTVVKLGCPDVTVVQGLSDQISEAIRMLPVTRDPGVSYRMNEVTFRDSAVHTHNCTSAPDTLAKRWENSK